MTYESERYSESDIKQFADDVLKDGFVLLPGHLSQKKLDWWNDKFKPLLDEHIRRQGQLQNRGPGRYYVTLPFESPFADEDIFCNPDILGIVENLIGADFTMVQLATDTPLPGSIIRKFTVTLRRSFPNGERDSAVSVGGHFPACRHNPRK